MQRHLIIGGSHPTAVGNSLCHAAKERDLDHDWFDFDTATSAPRIIRALYWHLFNKRTPYLHRFNRTVITKTLDAGSSYVHCVGNLPLFASSLHTLRANGVKSTIWLTDDPWSPAHQSKWLMQALPQYDIIFTPRKSNFDQLDLLAPGRVFYLPFGYDPRYFHREPDTQEKDCLFFAGGADSERVRFMEPIIKAGLNLALYGSYWNRYSQTSAADRGYAAPETLSGIIAQSSLAICLVRKSNRDGHCMRSFELPAAAACILAEDTLEHRSLFGPDGEAVVYFNSSAQAITLSLELLAAPSKRRQLRNTVYRLITEGHNTYNDRLSTILQVCNAPGIAA